jgi:glycosyltransferase involved in cell wall biosynthesis
MTDFPLVSVIIPTYNRADKLGDAIDSAISQTYPRVQVIVVDDGSIDHTAELMKNYPQVEYMVKNHAGQAAARNYGLKYSRGAIIASLDSDDIWNPDYLSKSVEKLERDQLDFVFSNWKQLTDKGVPWDFLDNDPFLQPHFKKTPDNWITLPYQDLRQIYLWACPSPSSSIVIKRSTLADGWDEKIHIGDDWCMLLDVILSKDRKVAFTLEKLWVKRIDAQNIFDGRKRSELLRFLYIEDHLTITNKIKRYLTPEEMAILEERYIFSLVELSKHEIFREHNVRESLKLLKISMSISLRITLKAIPSILSNGFTNKYKTFSDKLNAKKINSLS